MLNSIDNNSNNNNKKNSYIDHFVEIIAEDETKFFSDEDNTERLCRNSSNANSYMS